MPEAGFLEWGKRLFGENHVKRFPQTDHAPDRQSGPGQESDQVVGAALQAGNLCGHLLVEEFQQYLQIHSDESDTQEQDSDAQKEQPGRARPALVASVMCLDQEGDAFGVPPAQSTSLTNFPDDICAAAMFFQFSDDEGAKFLVHENGAPGCDEFRNYTRAIPMASLQMPCEFAQR
jgi:hypothetical protein